MKKILTASLVAMMAVTAANADIASTAYVDKAKQAAEATATGYNNAMNTRVTSLETDNTANKGDISKLKQDVAAIGGADGSISTQIAAAVQALDVDEITVADGKYVKTVSETDGKVSVTTGDLIGQINESGESKNDTSTVAPTTAAVAGYVQDKLNVMTNDVDTKITNALSGTKQDVAGLELDVANLEANSATKEALAAQNTSLTTAIAGAKSEAIAEAKGETTSQVSAAKTELQGKIDAINNTETGVLKTAQTYADSKVSELATGAVATNTSAIATLNGTGAGSVSKAVADAKDALQGQIDALNNGDNSVSKQIDNKIGKLADGAENVATAIANAKAAAELDATTKANAALAEAKSYADTAEADAISTAAADAKSKADQALADAKADAKLKIEALDKADTAVAGEYVSAVSEVDGVISVSRAALTPVAKMDVPADCATKLCALVYDKVNSSAGNPVLKWEVIAE